MENFFSTQGRIGRCRFFFRNIIIFAASLALCFLAGVVLALVGFKVDDQMARAVSELIELATVPFWAMQAVKRCHDMNISGWWLLVLALPVLSLGLILVRGTRGANRYGEDPRHRASMQLTGMAMADPLS